MRRITYHGTGSLQEQIEFMYAQPIYGKQHRPKYIEAVKLCEKLEKALRELLADSDRWMNDGCILAMPGTRSFKARENARKLLKLKCRKLSL